MGECLDIMAGQTGQHKRHVLVISRYGFECWIWVLIASVPGLCMPFTFTYVNK